MNYELNQWYSWPGYDAYKWVSIDEFKTILNLHAKSRINLQCVTDNRLIVRMNVEVGKHVWTDPCLFQVASIYVEPTSIWINQTSGPESKLVAHKTRDAAIKHADSSGLYFDRIAVEYVEKL